MSTPPQAQRPLSPHLQIYRPQMTSGMSIFHRFTAVGLAGGFVVFIAWLFCLAWLPEWFDLFTDLIVSPLGKIFLFGWTWAYFFHVGATIRHLCWDLGLCFSLDNVYSTAYIAYFSSIILTFALWAIALWHWGIP